MHLPENRIELTYMLAQLFCSMITGLVALLIFYFICETIDTEWYVVVGTGASAGLLASNMEKLSKFVGGTLDGAAKITKEIYKRRD